MQQGAVRFMLYLNYCSKHFNLAFMNIAILTPEA